jgi:class 3 adenylate cyclase
MATVIFCDIYDFDSICVLYKPHELTALLDDVFHQFDDLCLINGVVKIETVGKTYMACAGLRYVDQDLNPELREISHPRRAVEFALDLLSAASNYKIKSGGYLQVKIGINSGPVISGVVGLHKPQFSLVGDTVNTASRMCSTLEKVDAIQIAEATRDMMTEKAGLVFEPRTVYAKGKGDVQAYLVTGESGIDINTGRSKSLPFSKLSEMLSNFTRVDPTRDFDFNEEMRKSTLKYPQSPAVQDAVYQVGYLAAAKKQAIIIRKWNTALMCAIEVGMCGLRVAMLYEAAELVAWRVVVARCALIVISLISLHIWKWERVAFVPWLDLPFCMLAYTLSVFDVIFSTKYDIELVAMS